MGSEFVYVVITLAAAVFHLCFLLICLTGVLHMAVQILFVSLLEIRDKCMAVRHG